MPERALFQIAGSLMLTSVLAACASPYSQPAFEPADASFPGIAEILEHSEVGEVRILATHGMCSKYHGPNWVDRRAASIAAGLGLPYAPTGGFPAPIRYGDAATGEVKRYDIALPAPNGVVRISLFTWGSHIEAHRNALDYENQRAPTPGEPERAALNHTLRAKLMNTCLIDAVVYSGRNGDHLRSHMRHAMCATLGGRFTAAAQPGAPNMGADCTFDQPHASSPTVLMPESLGSIIMFDALGALAEAGNVQPVADALSPVRVIFLLANQIPLLDRANPSIARAGELGIEGSTAGDTEAGSLDRLLGLLAAGTARRLSEGPDDPIHVVAFSDPNDLVSYRLDPRLLDRPDVDTYRFTNVLTTNTPTYFGLIANPLAAHEGYEENQTVFDLVANGRK